jgi:membrane-bound lytic murein transglycosylase D
MLKNFCVIFICFICFNLYSSSKYINTNKLNGTFYISEKIAPRVDFWIDIFSRYDFNELVVYDTKYHIIYEVLDVADILSLNKFSEKVKNELIDARVLKTIKKYRKFFKSIHENYQNKKKTEPSFLKILSKFEKIKEKNKFLNAGRPGRIKTQRGHKSNFKKALYYSGKYISKMEKIFEKENIPKELTRIPFIESFFNPNAVSRKYASGIWQFMESTGKQFLKVHKDYDERNDPIFSTKAAAKMLKKNYKYLGSWPLAVTAYNYGRYGIKKALKHSKTKTLDELINKYNGRRFGHDSKNFYAEFLASLYLEKNYYKYFDNIVFAKSDDYKMVKLMKKMNINTLETILDIDKYSIKYYNPSLSINVVKGKASIPKGSRIKIPIDKFEKLLTKYRIEKNINNYVRII